MNNITAHQYAAVLRMCIHKIIKAERQNLDLPIRNWKQTIHNRIRGVHIIKDQSLSSQGDEGECRKSILPAVVRVIQ